MAIFTWTPEYSVNVPEFDTQHQRLFHLINRLADAMQQGRGKEAIGPVVNELAAYTKTHFTAEEAWMQRQQYPSLPSHKLLHAEFIRKVEQFSTKIASGDPAVSVEALTFLKDWLANHIKGNDKKYAPAPALARV